METFIFYIEDTRYRVPTIAFSAARDAEAAWQLAMHRLVESEHHVAINIFRGDDLLCSVRRGRGARVSPG